MLTPEQTRQAERAHDEHRKTIDAMFGSIITFAAETLKSAALVNGGSAAATLALISQVLDKRPALAFAMVGPLWFFGAGLLAAVVASGVSYIAQLCFQAHEGKHALVWEHPWTRPLPGAMKWHWFGISFQLLAIGLVGAAYVLALIGFMSVADALRAAAALSLK